MRRYDARMRRLRFLAIAALTGLAAMRASLACTPFEDSPGVADAQLEGSAVGNDAQPGDDASSSDASSPVDGDGGSDATVYAFADGGPGDFTFVGPGVAAWATESGKSYARITGAGTFDHSVPFNAKRVSLSFSVRVISGPGGGNPYVNVGAMRVDAHLPDAGDGSYLPRMLQQATSIEIGAEELPGGTYRNTVRSATASAWSSYTLTYVPGVGKLTLSNGSFADAVLPFALSTDVTSILAQAGALEPAHVIDLADLKLVVE